jgi:hypothetical protein
MNRELIRKWIETLRSGKYGKRRGVLRFGCMYCALGIAADIHPDWSWDKYYLEGYDDDMLPEHIRVDFGINDTNTFKKMKDAILDRLPCGSFSRIDLENTKCKHPADLIVVLNDVLDWDFKQIGDFLAETLLDEKIANE